MHLICISEKFAPIWLLYSAAPKSYRGFPPGLYEPGGLGFCVGAQCKEFEFFFTLAFKNQQLPNKNSSLSPFIKTGRCSNIESVFLHGSAWLGLSWGFPFMERVPPMCVGATCLASYRHLYVDWNAERRA